MLSLKIQISGLQRSAEVAVRAIWTRVTAVFRQRFFKQGASISAERVVTALYRVLLGREPDMRAFSYDAARVGDGPQFEDLVLEIATSDEFRDRVVRLLLESGESPIRRTGQLLLSADRFDILVFQTADPYHYYDMLIQTSRTVRQYCLRHDLRYESYIFIKRGYFGWHATFNRIVILKELVDSGFRGWFFYLDADALILNQGFDLRAYLSDKIDYAAIFLPTGLTNTWFDINVGQFLINLDSPQALELINKWYDAFMAISDETLRIASDWGDVPHDQDLLTSLLSNSPHLRPAVYLPDRTFWLSFQIQFTRGQAEGLAERRRDVKAIVDSLLGRSEVLNTPIDEPAAAQAKLIVIALCRALLGRSATANEIDLHVNRLRWVGLQYGLQPLITRLLQSEEFRSNFIRLPIRHEVGSLIIENGRAYVETEEGEDGCAFFGPYEMYPPGVYSVTFNIQVDRAKADDTSICGWADVSRYSGTDVLEKADLFIDQLIRDDGRVTLHFVLNLGCDLSFGYTRTAEHVCEFGLEWLQSRAHRIEPGGPEARSAYRPSKLAAF